jgi:ABC-type branched-subunit amino acid transport system ATPase component
VSQVYARAPSRGRARVDGTDDTGAAPHAIARRRVGRTFQSARNWSTT